MKKSLAEVLALSSAEITCWMAYGKVRPIGDEADDWLAALGVAASLNALGGKVRVDECLPDWWGEHKAGRGVLLSIDESVTWARAMAGKG